MHEDDDAALPETAGRIAALHGLTAMAEQGDFDILLDKRDYRRTTETIS